MNHLTLFEFNKTIRKALEKTLAPTYWIVAEIGELNQHPKGHCYLELIEKHQEKIVARMKATIWSSTYQNLIHWFERITGQSLKPGMKILLNAEVVFHEAYGLSLNILDIDANYTIGERERLKQEILTRLTDEELINRNKVLAFPEVPQRIAIISSEHSAGYQDFKKQLESNKPGYRFDLSFFPAQMQGDETTKSVVDALKQIFETIHDYDLVVVIRGGGAQADLDGFNTYLMGKAIARFPIPVITGIGHDRDQTIADTVAHASVKTPTAVAEFLIASIRSFEERIDQLFNIIMVDSLDSLRERKQNLDKISSAISSMSKSKINQKRLRLDLQFELINRGQRSNRRQVEMTLKKLSDDVFEGSQQLLSQNFQSMKSLEKLFTVYDPDITLQRGFSYSTIDGQPLHKIRKVKKGSTLKTVSSAHTLSSEVINTD
ncbi:MAG: exodeoxyribonuclease VII large subunit [Cyclobacteriaceae bacterium]